MSENLRPGSPPGDLRLVVFLVDGQRYALELGVTLRVLPMVAVSPLPGRPDVLLGAVNLHGEIVPVLDLRQRLGLRTADYGPTTRLLVAKTIRRRVALAVDDVVGVTDVAVEDVVPSPTIVSGIRHVSGIAALDDGLLLIHDLDAFFSLDEERQLADSLGEAGP